MCADLLAETGLVYSQQDVCRHLFGHRPPPERPLPPPAPRPGTVAVWCDQPLAAHYGRPHEVFGRYLRERLRLPDPVTLVSPAAGYYRRRLVPDCFEQTFDEQRRWLRPGEGLAPAAVVATMLLTHVIAAWDRDPFDDLPHGRLGPVPGSRPAGRSTGHRAAITM